MNELHLFKSFLMQKMEMGETEWCLDKYEDTLLFSGKPQKAPNENEQQLVKAAIEEDSPEYVSCCLKSFTHDFLKGFSTLEELREVVQECLMCSLGPRRTNFVFGSGNPEADIMFIGEAPGAEEDAQGKPFVGRAGQLLTKMIEAIKLQRGDVYIGNILKCRPPQNRDPLPEEVELCEPLLIRQIELIKPAIICALGRISGQTLLKTKNTLGVLRGKIHDYHGVKMVVTYHPAALLRNPNWKKFAWEDMKLLRREYDGLEL